MNRRIDSHQHYWRLARGDYGWLRADDAALAPIVRDWSPADLAPLAAAAGIGQTVLVQATDSVAETDWLLDLADAHDSIAAVVGWVDLSRPDAAATLARWSRRPKLKSVRPMLQGLPQVDWIATAPRPDAVEALLRFGLRFDALVKPWHLAPLFAFAEAWPALPIVIDHAAKPQLAEGWKAPWADDWRRHLPRLAALPNACCKFSGLLTEAAPAQRATQEQAIATVRPVWESLLAWFGPDRLMWGSDWPVLTLAAGYGEWVAASDSLIGELSPDEQALVRAGTAARFYGLEGAKDD